MLKDIKNVHLSVYPPTGRVRISAPPRMSLDTIRVFAISKLGWIKQQQKKLREQERETPREYLDRESHYVWGKRYLLKVIESDAAPAVELKHSSMLLRVRPGTSDDKKQAVVGGMVSRAAQGGRAASDREVGAADGREGEAVLRAADEDQVGKLQPRHAAASASTPNWPRSQRECLEYIVVHEMVHLLEPTHNARFVALMDQFMPKWQFHRQELNRLPVRHETWGY